MRKIVGIFILGLVVFSFAVNGAENLQSILDVLALVAVVILGLWLLFGGSGSGTRRKPASPPPAPPKPAEPTAAVCPDCGRRYPLTQVYCEECGALLEKK